MGPKEAKHLTFMMEVAGRTAPKGDARYGMISAYGDAARLLDAIATDMLTTGRPSKAREQRYEAVKRCADQLWAFRASIMPSKAES